MEIWQGPVVAIDRKEHVVRMGIVAGCCVTDSSGKRAREPHPRAVAEALWRRRPAIPGGDGAKRHKSHLRVRADSRTLAALGQGHALIRSCGLALQGSDQSQRFQRNQASMSNEITSMNAITVWYP
ncbi:MAG: hypothetical protein M3R08_01920 [Bacteroidota bacterium]|nr:hypothetical protein [Bacteroidota bacterium]